MSGNCATGSDVMAIRPAMVMTVETTKASRGRRMNSDEIVMASLLRRGGSGGRHCRRHGHARPHTLLALDDHLLARLQSLGDGDHAVARRAGLHSALLGHVLVFDDVDVGPRLADCDGRLRSADHGPGVRILEAHAPALALRQRALVLAAGPPFH